MICRGAEGARGTRSTEHVAADRWQVAQALAWEAQVQERRGLRVRGLDFRRSVKPPPAQPFGHARRRLARHLFYESGGACGDTMAACIPQLKRGQFASFDAVDLEERMCNAARMRWRSSRRCAAIDWQSMPPMQANAKGPRSLRGPPSTQHARQVPDDGCAGSRWCHFLARIGVARLGEDAIRAHVEEANWLKMARMWLKLQKQALHDCTSSASDVVQAAWEGRRIS